MRILLVEDNETIAKNVKKYLEIKKNWEIEIAETVAKAEELFQKKYFDFVLLDIMLPDGDGYKLAEIFKKQKQIPIIFLTAKATLEDKLAGFTKGADDYITKPFEMEELLARIQAVWFRYDNEILKYKNIYINLDKEIVTLDGELVQLTPIEFKILAILVKNGGKVVQRTDLIDYIWGEEEIWSGNADGKLDVYISNLRKKFGKQYFETVKGVGYKLI